MAIRDSNRGEYDWKSRTYRLENEVSNCISHYKNFIDAKKQRPARFLRMRQCAVLIFILRLPEVLRYGTRPGRRRFRRGHR